MEHCKHLVAGLPVGQDGHAHVVLLHQGDDFFPPVGVEDVKDDFLASHPVLDFLERRPVSSDKPDGFDLLVLGQIPGHGRPDFPRPAKDENFHAISSSAICLSGNWRYPLSGNLNEIAAKVKAFRVDPPKAFMP